MCLLEMSIDARFEVGETVNLAYCVSWKRYFGGLETIGLT